MRARAKSNDSLAKLREANEAAVKLVTDRPLGLRGPFDREAYGRDLDTIHDFYIGLFQRHLLRGSGLKPDRRHRVFADLAKSYHAGLETFEKVKNRALGGLYGDYHSSLRGILDAFENEVEQKYHKSYNDTRTILDRIIEFDEQFDPTLPLRDRLERLEDHVERKGSKGLSKFVLALFPELERADQPAPGSVSMPTVAPATWKADKQPGETPPTFVKRVYGEWLGKGFTRATLRHLDPPLAQAMTNWLRHNEMPADVDLPTLKEQNTRWVDRLENEGVGALLPSDSPEAALKEGRRLATLKHRRASRGN